MKNALGGLFMGAQDPEEDRSEQMTSSPDPNELNVKIQAPKIQVAGTSPAVAADRPKSEAISLGGAFAKGLKGMILGGTSPAPNGAN